MPCVWFVTDVVFVAVELPVNRESGGGGGGGEEDGGGSIISTILSLVCGATCKESPLAEVFSPSTGRLG